MLSQTPRKSTATLKGLSTTGLALRSAWTTRWIMELEEREHNIAGSLWSLAVEEKPCFSNGSHESHPDWFPHIHQFLLPFLRGLFEYIDCIFIATGSDVTLCTSFIWDKEFVLHDRLSSSSTKSKERRIGVLNWPLKVPVLVFISWMINWLSGGTLSSLLCFRYF